MQGCITKDVSDPLGTSSTEKADLAETLWPTVNFHFPEEPAHAQKVKNLRRSQHRFCGLFIERPVSDLRLGAKCLDSDHTVLTLLQAALQDSASISRETAAGVTKEGQRETPPGTASRPHRGTGAAVLRMLRGVPARGWEVLSVAFNSYNFHKESRISNGLWRLGSEGCHSWKNKLFE